MTEKTEKTYKERQAESIKQIRMTEELKARIKAWADANQMSTSEAMRELMGTYRTGNAPVGRQRSTVLVTFWSEPEELVEFKRKAKENGVTFAAAIEAALETVE